MKWFVFLAVLLFLLAGCAEELPPSPPAPGGVLTSGRAIGGIAISPELIPEAYSQIKYTDISPATAVFGDNIVVTVEKSGTKPFYVYSEAWVLNKKVSPRFWEKAVASTSRSGRITEKWAKDKAVFYVPVSTERFVKGVNYLLVYYCIDLGTRDSQGKKQWDCNSNKWGLGAFEVSVKKYPEILIENDITMYNKYQDSSKISAPRDAFTGTPKSSGTLGDAYNASYMSTDYIKTEVTVIKLLDVSKFKLDLSKELSAIRSKWRENFGDATDGFLFTSSNRIWFSWLSGSNWVTVKTFADDIEMEKVGAYARKYPQSASDSNLRNELDALAAPRCGDTFKNASEECDPPGINCTKTGVSGVGKCAANCTCQNITTTVTPVPSGPTCGDGNKNATEQCDPGNPPSIAANDSACPGRCRADCTCAPVGGVCGDGSKNATEQCDPGNPLVTPPIPASDAACVGLCKPDCTCAAHRCGDGLKNSSEECDPGNPFNNIYPDDDACPSKCTTSCTCPTPYCGDAQKNADEECDPGDAMYPNIKDDDDCPGECQSDCTCPAGFCGDHIVNNDEECDGFGTCIKNGQTGSCNDMCYCILDTCGNGALNTDEECDPQISSICTKSGRTGSCSLDCSCHVCGDGSVNQGSEECDHAVACSDSTKVCDSTCKCVTPTGNWVDLGTCQAASSCYTSLNSNYASNCNCWSSTTCDSADVGKVCSTLMSGVYHNCRCDRSYTPVSSITIYAVYDYPTGYAIRMEESASSSSSFVLMLVAAFGILFVTLLNFVHRE